MSKFCGTCGSMAADEARVCGNCGTPFEAAQNNFVQPQNNFTQPQYQQSYQPVNMYAPAPAPKKSKKGIIIGAAVAVVAIIVAVVIALSNGGGSSSKEKEEKKNTAKSVASQVVSYLLDGDADALVDFTSNDFLNYAVEEFGYDKNGVKELLKEQYEEYTDYIMEAKAEGYKVSCELGDYEESDEIEEIQSDMGDNITDIYIYEAVFCFEDEDGYKDEEDVGIMVWKNDGEWEFVTLDF